MSGNRDNNTRHGQRGFHEYLTDLNCNLASVAKAAHSADQGVEVHPMKHIWIAKCTAEPYLHIRSYVCGRAHE